MGDAHHSKRVRLLIEGHELHKAPTAVVRERWQRAFDLLFVKTVRTGDEHLNALRANLANAGFEAWEIDSLLQRYQKRPLALLSVLLLRLLAFREIAPKLMVKRAKKEQHSR